MSVAVEEWKSHRAIQKDNTRAMGDHAVVKIEHQQHGGVLGSAS